MSCVFRFVQFVHRCNMLFSWTIGGVMETEKPRKVVWCKDEVTSVHEIPRVPKVSKHEWEAQCDAFGERMRALGLAQQKTRDILWEEDMQDALIAQEHLVRRRARASRRTLLF